MWKLLTLLLLLSLTSACGEEEPAAADGPITLSRDSLSLTVDPAFGGRVMSLTYAGRELLSTLRDSSGFTYGSTAWPSPQADWGWPPSTTLDRERYTVQRQDEHSLLIISEEDPETGLTLQKRFRMGPDSDIGLTYWLTYRGDSIMDVAAWEITRLPYAGRIEFMADSVRRMNATESVEQTGDWKVIHFDERHTTRGKVFASLDTVPVRYYLDGLVLEKYTAVKDLYRVAPEQAPLEVYLDPKQGFIEFELQGDYRGLSYGESTSLRTRWRVVRE